jgi:hypothetical protein
MLLPKNGAAVHFILSDSILSLLRNSELGSLLVGQLSGATASSRNN